VKIEKYKAFIVTKDGRQPALDIFEIKSLISAIQNEAASIFNWAVN